MALAKNGQAMNLLNAEFFGLNRGIITIIPDASHLMQKGRTICENLARNGHTFPNGEMGSDGGRERETEMEKGGGGER